MSVKAGVTRTFTKPLVNAGVGAAALTFIYGADKSFYLGDTRIPVPLFGALLGGIGSFVTETVDTWVLPYTIGKDEKVRKLESMVISVGSSAAYFALLPKLLNSDVGMADMQKLAFAGAASEVASSYLYSNV